MVASFGKIHSGRRLGRVLALAAFLPLAARAEEVVVHLKNGDRIAGQLISENTNRVVISTSWIAELAIPTPAIERCETTTPAVASSSLPPPPPTLLAKPPAIVPPQRKNWKLEARAGADFLSGPKNQQVYYGQLKYTYVRPYASNPLHSLRNDFNFAGAYGFTQNADSNGELISVLSANRMYASDKTDFDFGTGRWFVYDLVGLGYDEVRKIDFQYAIGPGLGYHLVVRPGFLMNVESGVDYQTQIRSDTTSSQNVFFRVGQESTWKISPDVNFTEKFYFSPRMNSTDFRAQAEATLSYALWRKLSLNLSMLNLYDTAPAQDVTRNDLQVHTSVGVTF